MKFSPTTGCHYPDDIAYPEGVIPPDAIDVTDKQFALAMARAPGEALVVKRGKQAIVAAPVPTKEDLHDAAIQALRSQRDRLLTASDFTQLADAPLTSEQRAAWASYRQALRDLPKFVTDPENPDWPTPPAP